MRKEEAVLILMAKLKDGTLIRLTKDMKREHLRTWRQSTTFFCPQCNGTVQLKVGNIIIPHFAHKKEATCSASFSEGETQEHLQGKQQMYNFLDRVTKNVKLEPYFKALSQRPDLLVTINAHSFPIEFQCSTIPIAQVEARTSGYEKAGMNPIWIMATPKKLKTLPQGVNKFHFSRFEESFFTYNYPEGLVFLTYDPQFKHFHYFSTLHHIVGRQYIGVHRTLPISKQIFPFARPKIPSTTDFEQYYDLFKLVRRKFLSSRIFVNRRGINNPFLQRCYELRIIPSELPRWIGVPICTQNVFTEHPCEWQLALVYFFEQERVRYSQLSMDDIRRFVRRFGDALEEQVKACVEYHNFLLDMGIESLNDCANFDERLIKPYLSHYLQSEMKIEKI